MRYPERTDYYKKIFPFLREIFDREYYSWQTGFLKPDVKTFENVLSDQDLNPEECLFFDDSHENVLATQKLRIKSFLFENVESFKDDIEKELFTE